MKGSAVTIPTRRLIVDHVELAFVGPVTSTADVLAAAIHSHAAPEVISLLRTLPERSYAGVRDLWSELPEVPVE